MKYGFSNFTGRLSAPSPLEMPSKFGKGIEGPVIQYPLGTTFAKTITGARGKYNAVPEALLRKMTLFQLPNSLPVHLKGGPVDKVFFILTSVVCAAGLFECFRVIYILSYPQKKE